MGQRARAQLIINGGHCMRMVGHCSASLAPPLRESAILLRANRGQCRTPGFCLGVKGAYGEPVILVEALVLYCNY